MSKKSKVIAVNPNGSYSSNYGTFFKFNVNFENGDFGEYSSKSEQQNKFVVGQEAEYELTPNANPSYPAKLKPAQSGFSGKGKAEFDPTLSYLIHAKDIAVARATQSGEWDNVFKEIMDGANKFKALHEKMKNGNVQNNVQQAPTQPQVANPIPDKPLPVDTVTDDLPF